MATTKEFNISSNAVTVLNQTADAAENTAKGFTSAKAELRALQQQLLSMDQSSEEFKKASARAAELKDNISDLSAEISANAGNAFEGLSNNVGLFGSRLMDLDLKGAGQALAGMGAAVNKIDFKTLKEEIGGLIQGLGKLAKAVLANPYLMLAAAVALVIANFDTIIKQFPAIEKGLTGINEQERELLDLQTKKADQAKKNYDNISAMENTLKLQGFTEKQIRDMKIAALQASISEATVRLETAKGQEKAQIETAKRNREILEGVIRWINAPLYLLLSTVDKIASWVGQTTNLAEGLTNLAADLLIDPEQQQADLQKSFEEQEKTIKDMQNSLDGFIYEQQEKDKEARDKARKEKEDAQKEAEKDLEAAKKLYQETRNAEIAAEDDKYKALQALQETAQEKEITAAIEASEALYALAGDDAAAQILIAKNLAKQIAAINKKYKDAATEEAEKAKADKDKQNEANAIEAAKELDLLAKAEDAKAQLRVDAMRTSLSIISDLAQAFAGDSERQQKKAFQIQKGVSIATATIDTYLAAQGAYRSQMAISTPDAPVRAAVAAGIAIAQGLARVAVISKQQFNGGGGTSGANSSSGNVPQAGGMNAPSPANFAFLGNQPNQQQPPLQAYVVSGQVSSNLEAQQLIQNQSRLGG
jgi:hypothetical protein